MPRNCWTRCNKTFPCSFLTREKTREIESRETSRRLEKQAISALLRKMIYKWEFEKTKSQYFQGLAGPHIHFLLIPTPDRQYAI